MADNRVTVLVSNKFLQIDDISSEFEFLNNYLLLYILIRFIISVCFLSLDYCINTRLFRLIGRISQSLILLSFEIFFTLPVLKSITFSMKRGSSLQYWNCCVLLLYRNLYSAAFFYNLVNQSVEHYPASRVASIFPR